MSRLSPKKNQYQGRSRHYLQDLCHLKYTQSKASPLLTVIYCVSTSALLYSSKFLHMQVKIVKCDCDELFWGHRSGGLWTQVGKQHSCKSRPWLSFKLTGSGSARNILVAASRFQPETLQIISAVSNKIPIFFLWELWGCQVCVLSVNLHLTEHHFWGKLTRARLFCHNVLKPSSAEGSYILGIHWSNMSPCTWQQQAARAHTK